ncbi:MAG: alpha/beta fold hydrolase [Chloroflexaceae bacterium]|nr:alpha/beta fold hydrolase [Chloroflexaceae bacterium]
MTRTVEDGIERVVYSPTYRRFETPLLLQHGMWHGAWCWQYWQELFAEWGWESHAHSLPGHGQSPAQRPIRWCTLNYYFECLMSEIKRLPRRPVLMGHSMGGALTQWYFRYVSNRDLPAAVLVAPWHSHDMHPAIARAMQEDPWGAVLGWLSFSATPAVRTPQVAFNWFLTEGAVLTPQELHAKLGPESGLVLLQYTPPLWKPADKVHFPLLVLGAERDRATDEPSVRATAAYYGADYFMVPEAGHDLMLEKSYRQTAQMIHDWLVKQSIA